MNLPNRITIIRILMVPLILFLMLPLPPFNVFQKWNHFIVQYGNLIAFILFSLAALTDLIDGKIARKLQLVSNLGKFLDPIADKLLVTSVLIALVQQGRLNAIPIIIIIFREFIITGIRLAASDKGIVIAASYLGKAKTVSQIVAIMIILSESFWIGLFCAPPHSGQMLFSAGTAIDPVWILRLGDLAMMTAVILTLVSGFDYLWKNRMFLKE